MSAARSSGRLHTLRVVGLFVLWAAGMSVASIPLALLRLIAPERGRRFTWHVVLHHASRAMLRGAGLSLKVHMRPREATQQVIYVFNHTSSLDLFIVGALGLRRTRTFMKRAMALFVPLGLVAWAAGNFFTVPQRYTERRRQIFREACEELAQSGDSVFLSPEGTRHTTGVVGPFNRGAFHLALALRAPIVPLLIDIPEQVNPGRGWLPCAPGEIVVRELAEIDTSSWSLNELDQHKEAVRQRFLDAQRPQPPMRRAA